MLSISLFFNTSVDLRYCCHAYIYSVNSKFKTFHFAQSRFLIWYKENLQIAQNCTNQAVLLIPRYNGVFHQTAEARRVLHMRKIFSPPHSNFLIQIKISNLQKPILNLKYCSFPNLFWPIDRRDKGYSLPLFFLMCNYLSTLGIAFKKFLLLGFIVLLIGNTIYVMWNVS